MKTKFCIELSEDDDPKILIPYVNAMERDSFLFELKHNFFRKWKHSDKDPDIEEVKEELFRLLEEYEVI